MNWRLVPGGTPPPLPDDWDGLQHLYDPECGRGTDGKMDGKMDGIHLNSKNGFKLKKSS